MDRLIGIDVEVYLVSNDIICGTLFDMEDDCIYIQKGVGSFITIPKENIKYYVSRSFQDNAATPAINYESNSEAQGRVLRSQSKATVPVDNTIEVFVDGNSIISIPVIPTLDLSVFSDKIMKVVVGNPDVQMILANRTQKAVEYTPGKIMFFTAEGPDAPVFNEPAQPTSADSFAMGGNASSGFLNPSQMVFRLNKLSGEKKNE